VSARDICRRCDHRRGEHRDLSGACYEACRCLAFVNSGQTAADADRAAGVGSGNEAPPAVDVSFLLHAVANPSQYDATVRGLAQLVLDAHSDLVDAVVRAETSEAAFEGVRDDLVALSAAVVARADARCSEGIARGSYDGRPDAERFLVVYVGRVDARPIEVAALASILEAVRADGKREGATAMRERAARAAVGHMPGERLPESIATCIRALSIGEGGR